MLRQHRFTLTALACLTLAIAGCAADPERGDEAQAVADAVNVVFHHGKWRQIPATPENQAEAIVFEQRVAFGDATALLDRAGVAAIDRLLDEADPAPGSLIRLSVPGSEDGSASFDRITLQRLEGVRNALTNRGYDSALADSAVTRVAALQPGEVGLTLTKIVAVLPDCNQPQPRAPNLPDQQGAFGCSTTYNLGMMIADPADLERGRTLDPADAERASLSVFRYRLDDKESDELEAEDTKSQ